MSAISNPLLLPNTRINLAVEFGVLVKQTLGKQMADASGERQDVDEELTSSPPLGALALRVPLRGICLNSRQKLRLFVK